MDLDKLRERIALALLNERRAPLGDAARPPDWNWAGYSIAHTNYLKMADEIITPKPAVVEAARKMYSEACGWSPFVKREILAGLYDETSAMRAIKAALLLPQMKEE